MAGSRTRINCLEGSYADRYTTIAFVLITLYTTLFILFCSEYWDSKIMAINFLENMSCVYYSPTGN